MGIIDLKAVDTIYEGERIPAIVDINLKIDKNEFVCVVGPNGAGKTTLLETINGLLSCTRGEVFVFDKNIKENGAKTRCEISYVLQGFFVDPLTPFIVKDVVMMGRFGKIGLLRYPSKEDRKIVKDSMEVVGIRELANRAVGKLSGGQQQKVMIARAIAKEPKILLLDEPFANLDYKSKAKISEMICSLHDEYSLTTVLVTHDRSSIPKRTGRTVVMNKGKIVLDGKTNEMMGKEVLKSTYWTPANRGRK